MLFVTQSAGFKHGSVTRPKDDPQGLSPSEVAMIQLGQQSGLFDVDVTQDVAADFTKANLQNYDVVAFYTTGTLPIAEDDLEYFMTDWLRQKGHGFIGVHSAGDTFHDYKPYWDMAGGTFISHPWTSKHTVTLKVHDPSHPGAKPYGEEFVIQEEIYMYKNWQPEKVHLLMSLDYAKSFTDRPVPTEHGYHVPVAWAKEYGPRKGVLQTTSAIDRRPGRTRRSSIPSSEPSDGSAAKRKATPSRTPAVSREWEAKSRRDFTEHGFKQKETK